MNNIDRQTKIIFFKYGLILGFIFLALSILSYYFITQITESPALFVGVPIIFRLFIPVILTAFLCFNGRKKIGGYWTFKQATAGIFVMFLTAFFIQFLGKDMVFDKIVAPDNIQKTQAAAIRFKTIILKEKGTSEADIKKDNAEMKKDFALQDNSTIGDTIRGVVISILFVFILALLFGALFKKDPPVLVSKQA
ncbi:MAG TPA: DUF4199 domain-containing protein [Mucilaginibacter sp.]|nr:DUF4199 domain-containing protein [Mucilaginibacter sp.]